MNTNNKPSGAPVIGPLSSSSAPVSRPQRGRAAPWILGLVVLAAAAGGWWWWKGRAADGQAGGPARAASAPGNAGAAGGRGGRFAANRVQPVSVMPARLQDIRHTAAAIGTISASNTAVVRA